MSRRLALCFAAIAGLILPNLRADSVAALPGNNSLGSNVSVFEINPLNSISNFSAGDGAFVILPKPDGSKYYVISKSPTNSVVSVDSNFANPKTLASFQTSPTGAAITPDGTKLLVASTTLHIFDTTKDQELVAGGINPLATVIDVAVSLDGTKAYSLGLSSSGGSQVNIVGLAVNSVTGFPSYGLQGTATGITVGPNGRVYVSTQNQIIELDPTTLQPTVGGIIGVNALPGKMVFTPDGKYGLAVNQTPITGQSILLIDLNAHSVTNFVPNNGVVFDTLLAASSATVFAYSSQSQSLYQLGIGTGGSIAIAGANIGGAPVTFVNGVALSNEIPFAGNTTAHYLFVAANSNLYRVDLTTGPQVTAQTALATSGFNSLDYVALPSAGPAVVLLSYGDKQTVSTGKTSLPLVVRALDTNGKPASGVPITFAASVNTASVSPTTATTGSDGFAQTILTAPPTNGTVTVVASSGKLQFGFTITVGSGTTTSSGTMIITAGQGQILASDTSTAGGPTFGSPLTVSLQDVNGKPLAGVAVAFSVTPTASASGLGSLSPAAGFTGAITKTGASVTTNSLGVASANFLTSVVANGLGSSQTAITAKAAGTNSVIFYETTYPLNTAFTPTVQILTPVPGTVLTGQAGTIIPGAFTAAVADGFGSPLPNVSIHTCQPNSGDPGTGTPPSCILPPAGALIPFGTCNDPTGQGVLSDAHGKITCDLLLNGIVGSGSVGAQYGYHFDTLAFPLIITAGPPGVLVILQGNNQTGKPGQTLPLALKVQLQDSFGNVLPNFTPVTFAVLSSGVAATVATPTTGTDATGSASTLVTLGQAAGTVIIQATAGNASASFSLTVTNPATGLQPVSGDGQTGLVGTPFAAPLVVKVVDAQGSPVTGAAVTFTLSSGSASIGTPSTTTDTTGQASTTVTAGSNPGNIVIVAASGSFNTTFTLSSHLAGPTDVAFVNGANFQTQPGCAALGCVAPGEIVTVEGSGFATGVQGVVSGLSILGPLQTSLAGVSITFNGVAAPIFYVANVNGHESMTIQVPFETQLGNTTVVLNAAGGGSATYTVPTQLYAAGVFTSTYGNQTIAVAVRSNGTYVSPTNPVQPGETIYVFATGLGQVNPAAVTNTPGSGQLVTANVITGLNNKGVPHGTVDYAPGLVGVYIIAVQVPQDVQTGTKIPFGLILSDSSGNTYHTATTFLPIQ